MYVTLFILIGLCSELSYCHIWEPLSPYTFTDKDDLKQQTTFQEFRARSFLRSVIGFGPRPTGSENHKRTSEYIVKQLIEIKKWAKTQNEVHVQIQKSSGSFTSNFGDQMTVYYRAVQNLLVRIGPPNAPSLLISCHYDTVPYNTGVTSSAFHCAVMVEVFFVMTQNDKAMNNSVIFLFNGATENGHQSAHGFITKHPWAKKVVAFLNMDSFGSVGRLMALEAGPENPWMVEGFAYSVSFPLASIIAQEIINTEVFWISTDYKIFYDIGQWPGLDLNYISNGYIQRTKYDTEANISPKDLIQAGKNMMLIIEKLSRSPYIFHPIPFRKTKVVYFDVLGFFLVSYSIELGTVMNEIIAVLTVLEMAVKIKIEREDKNVGNHVLDIVAGTFITAFGCLLATGWNSGLGILMEVTGYSMSWYNKSYWIIGLYVCPAVACLLTVHWITAHLRRKRFRKDWLAEDKFYDATRVFWIVITCALTRSNYQAAYVCITWVLFPTLIRSLLGRLIVNSEAIEKSQENPRWLIILHFLMQIVPLILTIYTFWMIFVLLIPNLGRVGSEYHSDIIIGVTTALMTFAILSYTLTLLQIKPCHIYLPWIIGVLTTVHVIVLIILLCNISFPYSGNVKNPSPQIYFIVDVDRTFKNEYGFVEKYDTGYWLVPNDLNGIEALVEALPEINSAEKVSCDKELICGMPYHIPLISRFRKTYYFKNSMKHRYNGKSVFKVISVKEIRYNILRLTFRIEGTDHMSIALSPRENIIFRGWSITRHVAPLKSKILWRGRPTYFIYYAHGEFLNPWKFWIDINMPMNYTLDQPIMDIAFVCHYLHGNQSMSQPFSSFLKRLPNWIHFTPWTANYEQFTITGILN